MSDEVRLVGLAGVYGGKTYPLREGETSIGRGEECTLQIVDARISRTHARLISEGDNWILEDLGSTHGTFVKGEKIEKVTLKDGDTITIGTTLLRFEQERSQDDVPTQMLSPDEAATMMDSPDAVPTKMVSDDDIATILEPTPSAVTSPDDVPTQFVSPDDQATMMASEVEGGVCAQCGHKLAPDEKFCGECGATRASTPPREAPLTPPTRIAASSPPEAVLPPPPAAPPLVLSPEKKPFPWKWVAIGGGLIAVMLIVGVGLVLLRGLVGDESQTILEPMTPSDEVLVLTQEALGEEDELTPIIPPTLTPTLESETTTEVPSETPEATVEMPAATAETTDPPTTEPVIPSGATIGGSVHLAFASNRTGRPQIYLIDLETLEEKQLTDSSAGACQPTWSSDGGRLAYTTPCNTNREEYSGSAIFAMNVDPAGDPGEITELIVTIGGGDYDPNWSRDGSRIAFTSWRTGRPQVFTINADGTDPRNLNDDLAYNWAPTWSHDGSQVAFLTGRGGDEEIWIVPAAGGEEVRFSRSDGKDVARPAWSPDGVTIVFEKIVGNIPRLIAAPVADGGVRELKVCQEGQLSLQPMGEPAWSPDGTWLAFETWPDGVNHEIAIMRASCTEYRQLTTSDGLDFDAAWRPLP